jgi:serine protease Do
MITVFFYPLVATTIPTNQIEKIAREVTVLIKTPDPLKQGAFIKSGSGVIVATKGEEVRTYYILTAKHIVTSSNRYKIITPDGIERDITNAEVIKMDSTDLALLTLRTRQNYTIPTRGDSDELTAQDYIYIYGWPSSTSFPRFTSGKFVDNRLLLANDGYGLVYRDAQVENGMSGAFRQRKDGKSLRYRALQMAQNSKFSIVASPEVMAVEEDGITLPLNL